MHFGIYGVVLFKTPVYIFNNYWGFFVIKKLSGLKFRSETVE